MLSRNPRNNPYFYDHTLVEILYCSGDVHAGNVTRSYYDSFGLNVTQAGAANTLATFNWLLEQGLTPDELIVAGCSAGSIGAQVVQLDSQPRKCKFFSGDFRFVSRLFSTGITGER